MCTCLILSVQFVCAVRLECHKATSIRFTLDYYKYLLSWNCCMKSCFLPCCMWIGKCGTGKEKYSVLFYWFMRLIELLHWLELTVHCSPSVSCAFYHSVSGSLWCEPLTGHHYFSPYIALTRGRQHLLKRGNGWRNWGGGGGPVRPGFTRLFLL